MKYLVLATVLFYSLVSCDSFNKEEKPEIEKKVSKRDYSITKANSYSDLFLDSMVMEKFIADNQLNDSITRRMRSFYNTRNYQFAWFTSNGLTEQARGFWNIHDYQTTYKKDSTLIDKKLQKRMDNLTTEESLTVSDKNKTDIETELKLTQHFITYILNSFEEGFVKRKEMERFVPRKKEDALALSDSLVNKKHKDDKYYDDVNRPYRLLKGELAHYLNIAKQGGWQPISTDKKSFKKGVSAPEIAAIKRRLYLTRDLPVNDTSQVYNDTLEIAVKTFQQRFGFKPDGVIDAPMIKQLNIPVETRVQQIYMNLERMRWMWNDTTGRRIVVNIPEFVLHIYEGEKRVMDMVVVVGKEGHNTMMFTGDLNQVVFSPYWNVPPSIVKNEILPAMERNPGYLDGQNMEITGDDGGLPSIRQRPGPGNSLGKVKFLFPNSFNIYFHDTPSKSLFEREQRAFSHGCIRLSDPFGMAKYLLQDQPEWTDEKIRAAMDAGTEKYVKLDKPVPVLITYYTAWVDEYGKLNFRDDIYGHDEKLAKKMFTNPVTAVASR